MASSILGPSQIIFTPGTIYDLEIIFSRRPHDPTTTRHFWRCSRRFPLPPSPTLEQAVAVLWAMRPFLSRTAIHGYPAFRGRNYPGTTSVTISLWRRICFCRSLNHRNDWDPTPCSSRPASCASHQAINHIVVDHQHRGNPQPATRYSSSRGIIVTSIPMFRELVLPLFWELQKHFKKKILWMSWVLQKANFDCRAFSLWASARCIKLKI